MLRSTYVRMTVPCVDVPGVADRGINRGSNCIGTDDVASGLLHGPPCSSSASPAARSPHARKVFVFPLQTAKTSPAGQCHCAPAPSCQDDPYHHDREKIPTGVFAHVKHRNFILELDWNSKHRAPRRQLWAVCLERLDQPHSYPGAVSRGR